MPRYYFKLDCRRPYYDEDGMELPDDAAARQQRGYDRQTVPSVSPNQRTLFARLEQRNLPS